MIVYFIVLQFYLRKRLCTELNQQIVINNVRFKKKNNPT